MSLPRLLPDPPPPPPLTVACSLVAVEAFVFLILAVLQIGNLEGDKLVLGFTTTLFFLGYGLALGYAAWRLAHLHSWARAPVVLAQLIQILVGGGFWGGSTSGIAVVLVLVGLLALAGIFHPQSLAALEPRD